MKYTSKVLKLMITVCAFAFIFQCIHAQIPQLTKAVFFGDSLSAQRNDCDPRDSHIEKCYQYSTGQFTDGNVWVTRFAENMNYPTPFPSTQGGLNFAYGGATTSKNLCPHKFYLGKQVDTYLNRHYQIPGNQLYVIWAGGNDLKNNILSLSSISTRIFSRSGPDFLDSIDRAITDVAKNIKQQIIKLADAGGRHFLVPNLPPLDHTPISQEKLADISTNVMQLIQFINGLFHKNFEEDQAIEDAIFDALAFISTPHHQQLSSGNEANRKEIQKTLGKIINAYIKLCNKALSKALDEVEKESPHGITVYRFNTYALLEDLKKNPYNYGLTPSERLFAFDGFHPTRKVHNIFADQIAEKLNSAEELNHHSEHKSENLIKMLIGISSFVDFVDETLESFSDTFKNER